MTPCRTGPGIRIKGSVADCILMNLDASDLIHIALFLGTVVLAAGAGLYAHRQASRSSANAEAMLARRGYVRQLTRREGGGPVTHLWGPLPAPTPIYLRVCNNDGVMVALGDLFGLADMKVGEPRFDAAYVVRSNHPDAARAVLDEDMRRRLKGHRGLDFCTGAISNLLGPDHLKTQTEDRDLRTLWSLYVAGDLSEAQCKPMLALAHDLVARLQAQADQGGFASDDYRVGSWEGR
jgi:hypothetical protein